MKTRQFMVLLIVYMGTIGALVNAAPIQWAENEHYYEVYDDFLQWSEARDFASGLTFNGVQGHLVTITSAEEDAFVLSLQLPEIYYHTGALQLPGAADPAADWTWITGEAWEYDNWVGPEPNDAFGNEDNMVLMNALDGWGDMDGDDTRFTWTANPFIVEFDKAPNPVPEPGTLLMLLTGLIGIIAIRKKRWKER